ncbi:MAG: Wzz/FepE/Etk N-terminal domain-containing protein [Ardenticatenia bacterium]|nr:Wzz/FepE/Etk N-terminal domain-containing protein [Ardenticatenia bacterium]
MDAPRREPPPEWYPAYEDEVDLRKYVLLLMRFWYWPVGLAVVAAVTAAVVSLFVLTPTYEATAMAAVAPPVYVVRLTPGEEIPQIEVAQKALPQLATSDEVLQKVLARVPAPEPGFSLQQLKDSVSAESGSDPSIVELRVSGVDPEWAAQVANVWGEVFVEHANLVYGESANQVALLERQLARVAKEREVAEQAVVEFQAKNELGVLRAQLDSVRQAYAQRLGELRQLNFITKDVQGLRDQVAAQPPNEPVQVNDELTALFLQIQVFNAGGTGVQLQVSPEELRGRTSRELATLLDQMLGIIDEKSAVLKAELENLDTQILELQGRIAAVELERTRLEQRVSVARQKYSVVNRRLEEARLAVQAPAMTFKVASRAAPPEEPARPKPLLNTLLAGVLGGFLGAFAVFVAEFLRPEEQEQVIDEGREAGVPQPAEM